MLTSPAVALLTAHRSSAVQGRAGAVRFLLQAGADPNLADWEHRLTPLHLAAVGKQAHMRGEVVQLLLAGRARLWAEDAHGRTPLHYARQHEVEDGSGPATVSILPHEDMTGLERFSELRRITPVRKR